jgi:hypothetical protein
VVKIWGLNKATPVIKGRQLLYIKYKKNKEYQPINVLIVWGLLLTRELKNINRISALGE